MKKDEMNLTREELDRLCRLYMDCRLSVLEEKELEYILTTSTLTSESIAEVKSLMNVGLLTGSTEARHNKSFWTDAHFIRIAASIVVLLCVGLYVLLPRTSGSSEVASNVYITAYSNGKCLSRDEALEATDLAMAKADSLMRYASAMEQDYSLKANTIIETLSN